MKKRLFILIIVLITGLVSSFAATSLHAASPMPSWSLIDVRNGQLVDSEDFSDKVLLLTFFATWCPPCVAEVPVLNELHQEFREKGFSVIGLSVDQQGAEGVAKFVAANGVTYPVLLAKAKTTRDFGGVYGIPVSFLVNKAGKVVKKYTGYVQHGILAKDITSLMP